MEATIIFNALKLVGYGLATLGPALAIGIACYGYCSSAARQPELQPTLFTGFIMGAAFAEALGLLGFVLAFVL